MEHWNLTRYLNMVLESDWHDDTDVARAVHSPHGNIHIQSPYLDPSLFNPLATTGTHLASLQGARRRRRWGVVPRGRPSPLPRLCVPLPVPHPAELSIIIHNRAGEQELPMDLCRPLLRELREVPQPASAEYLSTMREGGTSRYTTHLSPTHTSPSPPPWPGALGALPPPGRSRCTRWGRRGAA